MNPFTPLRDIASEPPYGEHDVMVLFGELFQRGYANGLVEEAQKRNMKIIYSTVGRRDDNQRLRALTPDEIINQPMVNVPLEAGFDLEPAKNAPAPVEQLKGVKMSEWQEAKLDWDAVEESRQSGIERFRKAVSEYLQELSKHIPSDANVLFVHTMAGGFPRAKVVMPAANRVFKGYDERYCSSEAFWQSDIGRLCDLNFKEVTGETLFQLIDLSQSLQERQKKAGKKVSFVAYGYHGTEVLMNGEYQWQSYSPYLQGWAKLRLEEIAAKAFAQDIPVCVFNCPEILTNSSSIFLGVEVSLYPLLGAIQRESANPEPLLSRCQSLLSTPHTLKEIVNFTDRYLESPTIKACCEFEKWPQHNEPEQMRLMRTSSAELIAWHKDNKDLITQILSEVVFKACGKIMFHEAWHPRHPVAWIGHDIIAKQS